MERTIKALVFGSCGLHIPTWPLMRDRFLHERLSRLGYLSPSFALSTGAAVQLHECALGERTLSEAVRMLALADATQPGPENRQALASAEVALVEMSTPIEPTIGRDVVNFNRVNDFVVKPLRAWGVDSKLVNTWSNALFHLRDDIEERRAALLANWPRGAPDDTMVRFIVENLQCRRLTVDEMVRDLEHLRDRLQAPLVLNLYDFRFTPDGRAIAWPTGFKDEQVEVARRIGAATINMTPVMHHMGVKRILADDLMHWRDDTASLRAQMIYDVLAGVLGRPRLDAYPRSAGLRRETEAAFPELLDMGPLVDFPGVAHIPPEATAYARGVAAARPPGGTAPGSDELAENLNDALLALHRGRLEEMGVTASGLGPHYQSALDQNLLIGRREERVLEVISQDLPPYDAYAVMRAGLGELAILIAASGRKAIAFEPNAGRRAAIEAGRTHLEEAGLLAPGALTIVATLTPPDALEGRVLGVGLDVVQVMDDAAAAPHLARLTAFEALLIVPRTFLRLRSDSDAQSELADALARLGFEGRRNFPGDGLSWFHRSGVAVAASGA